MLGVEQDQAQAGAGNSDAASSRTLLRRIAPNLLLLLGSVVLVSLATELAFRLYCQGTLSTEYLQQQIDTSWLGVFTQASPQAALRYELKPGVDVNCGGRVVTSNDGSQRISSARPVSPAPAALKFALL